mgnify:CR=1 FL=1
MENSAKPLSGLKVVEFTHMVMGPAAGLVLADLGADVVKVEPVAGDKTRRLKGSGAGYFAMYNRNKKSLAIDLKSEEGAAIAKALISESDVFIENFRPGALEKLGFGYEALSKLNPRLIYCSEKGFLPGPYENRTALEARHQTGKGQQVSASLFETTAFLVGQHMAQFAVTGHAAAPMPTRISAWAVYDVFDVKDDEKVFVGVVSDGQWQTFCKAFDLQDWAADTTLADNNDRVARREEIIPRLRDVFASYSQADLMAKLEKTGLPFAPITRPEDLFDDPHLNAQGGLLEMNLPDGGNVKLPSMPITMDGVRCGLSLNPPKIGEHSQDILKGLGYTSKQIDALVDGKLINTPA